MLRFGISLKKSFGNVWDSNLLDKLSSAGVKTIEIEAGLFMGDEGKENSRRACEWQKSNVPVISSLHIPFHGVDISHLSEDHRYVSVKNAIDSIEACHRIGAGVVVLHGSAEPIPGNERASRIQACRRSLDELCTAAQHRHIKIALELLPRTCLGNTVEELRIMCNGYPEDVLGFCLDVNHLMDRYATLPLVIRDLGKSIYAIHLSDYNGIDEQHWMPGKGVISWPGVIRTLNEIGYDGPFNYECGAESAVIEQKVNEFKENYKWLMSCS